MNYKSSCPNQGGLMLALENLKPLEITKLILKFTFSLEKGTEV